MILELVVDKLMVEFQVDISQNNSYQLMCSSIIGIYGVCGFASEWKMNENINLNMLRINCGY